MDHLIPAAPWLMALAAVVSAVACLAAGRRVPWQGRQAALVMSVAMVIVAAGVGGGTGALLVGAVLLLSAMLGTIGVRGTPAAAACCHRALVSVVMAVCAFQGAVTADAAGAAAAGAAAADAAAAGGHAGHGFGGVLSVIGIIGVIAVVLWTIVAEWFAPPLHRGRAARLLAVESWAMAAGVAVMCVGL